MVNPHPAPDDHDYFTNNSDEYISVKTVPYQ